jgi:hypothetical protein
MAKVAGISLYVDEIREVVLKTLVTEWVYRFHAYILYGGCTLLFVGCASQSYRLFKNYVAYRSRWIGFYATAFVAVGSMVLGSYEFLFRQVDLRPIAKMQSTASVQTILSQQITTQPAPGGFRFSQTGISNDDQVWTTAQCLVALLEQDLTTVKSLTSLVRLAFAYVERSRLTSSGDGWGYLASMNWDVTEIDAWVALAYLLSLRTDNAALILTPDEIPEVQRRANLAVDLILKRHHDDGGWSVVEKTSNPRHERTYSTLMADWPVVLGVQFPVLIRRRGHRIAQHLLQQSRVVRQSVEVDLHLAMMTKPALPTLPHLSSCPSRHTPGKPGHQATARSSIAMPSRRCQHFRPDQRIFYPANSGRRRIAGARHSHPSSACRAL